MFRQLCFSLMFIWKQRRFVLTLLTDIKATMPVPMDRSHYSCIILTAQLVMFCCRQIDHQETRCIISRWISWRIWYSPRYSPRHSPSYSPVWSLIHSPCYSAHSGGAAPPRFPIPARLDLRWVGVRDVPVDRVVSHGRSSVCRLMSPRWLIAGEDFVSWMLVG